MRRTLALFVVLALTVQSCCTCDHPARLPIVSATEAAQLAAIDYGMDLREMQMKIRPQWEYWEGAPINDLTADFIVELKQRCEGKEYYAFYFSLTDPNWSGGDLWVFVNKHPIEVLGLIGGE